MLRAPFRIASTLGSPRGSAAIDFFRRSAWPLSKRESFQGLILNGAAEFLGVPYAEPPIGNLRWKPANSMRLVGVLKTQPAAFLAREPSRPPFEEVRSMPRGVANVLEAIIKRFLFFS